MTTSARATWAVDRAGQEAFVALSGDCNPLHVDELAARRLPFGRVAVHGMHLALDALERVCLALPGVRPSEVRAAFRHPVGIDDEITTEFEFSAADTVTAHITTNTWNAAEVHVALVETGPLHDRVIASAAMAEPADTMPDPTDAHGSFAAAGDERLLTMRFPTLVSRLGIHGVASLVSLSRLVGMEMPGRDSLLSSLAVELRDQSDDHRDNHSDEHSDDRDRDIDYRVRRFDPRFSRVDIDVEGASLIGSLVAFIRPRPIEQAVRTAAVRAGEFAGWRALVVGGSRGLGAATVELLRAGGADVRFTFHRGADDAGRVVARTGASAWPLDVSEPEPALDAIADDSWSPTHLAHFASPPIFVGAAGSYSRSLLAQFEAVYVTAFERIVGWLVERHGPGALRGVLWPSSLAVVQPAPGLAEYADAKRAGERACAELTRRYPGLTVHAPRLPRLLTDQSTSFVPVEFGDTTQELLDSLRHLD